uniref:Uncharacterized protein n=1 Tax=Anguilla anguilla TaxID=7936 RepID=A0A0E9S8D9_ANGAN
MEKFTNTIKFKRKRQIECHPALFKFYMHRLI